MVTVTLENPALRLGVMGRNTDVAVAHPPCYMYLKYNPSYCIQRIQHRHKYMYIYIITHLGQQKLCEGKIIML